MEKAEILELIFKWAVPFLCGGAVTLVISLLVRLKSIKQGLQCLLRAEIIRSHDKYVERGYCPIYAKESMERAYNAYHALKGNDVATQMYHETIALPERNGGEHNERK